MKHICYEDMDYCCCYVLGLEPDEGCPRHSSGPWPPRCDECGRFMPYSSRSVNMNIIDDLKFEGGCEGCIILDTSPPIIGAAG